MKPGSSRQFADIGTLRQPRTLSIRVLLLAGVNLAVISVIAVPLYQGSSGGMTKAKAASVRSTRARKCHCPLPSESRQVSGTIGLI